MNDLVAVLIPARDEAATIEQVVRGAKLIWPIVLVVDDGSLDATGKIADSAGAHVITNDSSLGYGGAVQAGLLEAAGMNASAVILMDADGAHNPAESSALFNVHKRTLADLTIGSRLLEGRSDQFPDAKVAANMLGAAIFNRIFSTSLTDVASGYRVIGPKLMSEGISVSDFGGAFDLLSTAIEKNYAISETPISVRYDASEIFSTQRSELLNFLTYVRSKAKNTNLGKIDQLFQMAEAKKTHFVLIDEETYYLHYIMECDAYLIQRQVSEFFNGNRVAREEIGVQF